ncbi:MAG: hypothetical protein U0271_43455 [Polyangiaceae bacterium]
MPEALDADLSELVTRARRDRYVVLAAHPRGASLVLDAAARLAGEGRSLVLQVPPIESDWLLDELAALVIDLAQGTPASSEDRTGLIDAAGETLRAMNISTVTLLDAEPWLRAGGSTVLRRWVEASEGTTFLVTTGDSDDLPTVELRDPSSTLLDTMATIAALPTALPVALLQSVLQREELNAAILELTRAGLIKTEWLDGALFVQATRRARRLATNNPKSTRDDLLRAAHALFIDLLDEAGDPRSAQCARFLTRNRVLLRFMLECEPAPRMAGLALLTAAAMDTYGPLTTALSLVDTALTHQPHGAQAASLRLRRATTLRTLGRLADATDEALAIADAPAGALPKLAWLLEVLATPENDRPRCGSAQTSSCRSSTERPRWGAPRPRAQWQLGRGPASPPIRRWGSCSGSSGRRRSH